VNKEQLFAFFEQQDSPVRLQFLHASYDAMTTDQREAVFGEAVRQAKPLPVDGPSLLEQVRQFQCDSLAGNYYAPFDINSKNFTHVPEETKAWFDRLGDLLTDNARLSEQGDHTHAVACFRILYELIETMCSGEEIVFADEYGTWMIPVDEKKTIPAYLTSMVTVSRQWGVSDRSGGTNQTRVTTPRGPVSGIA
jgi:hypothetical protein